MNNIVVNVIWFLTRAGRRYFLGSEVQCKIIKRLKQSPRGRWGEDTAVNDRLSRKSYRTRSALSLLPLPSAHRGNRPSSRLPSTTLRSHKAYHVEPKLGRKGLKNKRVVKKFFFACCVHSGSLHANESTDKTKKSNRKNRVRIVLYNLIFDGLIIVNIERTSNTTALIFHYKVRKKRTI